MFYSPSRGGFYSSEIHHNMPEDAVEISDDRHAELVAGQTEGKRIVAGENGLPMLVDPPTPVVSPAEIRAECARRMAALVAQYAPEERETWPIQVAEAQAVMAGQTDGLVMLPELAKARGLPLATFAGAVLQIANATKAATAHLLAAQAKLLAMPDLPADFADDRWWAQNG